MKIGICTQTLLVTLVVLTIFTANSDAWWSRRRRTPAPPPPPPTPAPTPAPLCGGCSQTTISPQDACERSRTVTKSQSRYTSTGWWFFRRRKVVYYRVTQREMYKACCDGYVLGENECFKDQPVTCGKSKYDSQIVPQIVGGSNARPNQFPWMVSLRYNDQHFCGGAIIASRWIITAAHCLPGIITPSMYRVHVGDHQLSTTDSAEQIHTALQHYRHPDYDNTTKNHDIALIRLTSEISFNTDRMPICMPTVASGIMSNLPWYIMGWGYTETDADADTASETLQYARAYPARAGACNIYRYFNPNNICVSDNSGDDDRSVCKGDSGGPLAAKATDGTHTIVGVANFVSEIGCAEGHPFAFLKVDPYLDWIYQYVMAN